MVDWQGFGVHDAHVSGHSRYVHSSLGHKYASIFATLIPRARSSVVERVSYTHLVAGSIPAVRTTKNTSRKRGIYFACPEAARVISYR